MDLIKPSKARRTMCEWKGMAAYHDLQFSKDQGPVVTGRIWSYPQPTPGFASIKTTSASTRPARPTPTVSDNGNAYVLHPISPIQSSVLHVEVHTRSHAPFFLTFALQMVDDDEVKAQEGDFCECSDAI